MGCYALLQGIVLTQQSNLSLCLLHWQIGSLPLPPGKPRPLYSESGETWCPTVTSKPRVLFPYLECGEQVSPLTLFVFLYKDFIIKMINYEKPIWRSSHSAHQERDGCLLGFFIIKLSKPNIRSSKGGSEQITLGTSSDNLVVVATAIQFSSVQSLSRVRLFATP